MIAIADENGTLIKSISADEVGEFGFHRLFGLIRTSSEEARLRARRSRGLKAGMAAWLCRFVIDGDVQPLEGCQARREGEGRWWLETQFGRYQILIGDAASAIALPSHLASTRQESDRSNRILAISLAALFLLILSVTALWTAPAKQDQQALPEPVAVNIVQEKHVVIPALNYQSEQKISPQQIQQHQARRAVQQNLGFLGLVGKKNLTKALGGMPTHLKDVSPGAGAGGKAGSGGEVLVGLGQGVKRISVGNTGVQGLGGIGTKGAGGGAGGYGNTMVGSGNGRGLTSIPLSREVTLEGGLDRSVIQATIAKYLSQVRACYEQGLKDNPGLTGQVSMAFEIGGSGALNYAHVAKSSLGNPGVEQCIATHMMSWQFPKPLGGVNVKVNYPFLLRPTHS